jgi:hypothetical protein
MATFSQGDLVKVKHAIEYGPCKRGRSCTIKAGTPGVIVKGLTGGEVVAYFHGHPVIVVGDTSTIRRR